MFSLKGFFRRKARPQAVETMSLREYLEDTKEKISQKANLTGLHEQMVGDETSQFVWDYHQPVAVEMKILEMGLLYSQAKGVPLDHAILTVCDAYRDWCEIPLLRVHTTQKEAEGIFKEWTLRP